MLKTTQSGYEGYCMDKFTLLGATRERIMATSVTATWRYVDVLGVSFLFTCTPLPRYSRAPANFDRAYEAVKEAMCEKFFGPSDKGVYSPSVQFTMYEMGANIINKCVNC